MTPLSARLTLLGLLALFVGVYSTPHRDSHAPPKTAPAPTGRDDGALFDSVVGRVRSGEPYYDAMGTELRQRSYPASSIFNWRTPALYFAMAATPHWVAVLTIVTLAVVTLVLTVLLVKTGDTAATIIVGSLAQVGQVIIVVWHTAQIQTETWCGILIALSALLYARRAWASAALIGLSALFVRELAAPYCIVCVLLAIHRRRWLELRIWASGAAAYAVFFSWHVLQVRAHQLPEDAAHVSSWVQWGGLPFLITTTQSSSEALMYAPHVVVTMAIVLMAAALWSKAIPVHVGATVVAYALFFLCVGQPFNDYWGWAVGPTQAVAMAYGIDGIQTLVRRAFIRSPQVATVTS